MVSKSIDEVEKITEQVLDGCYISAIVQYLDLELNQCIEIAKLANKNMIEVKEIINKDGELYFKMLNDEKLRGKIKEEIKKLIGEKKLMSAEVPNLKKTYPKVSIKDLTIMWAESKEELKADKELKEVIKKHLPKKEIPYAVTEKEIEDNKRAIPVNEVVKELGVVDAEFVNPNKSKLKILEQTIKGEYGTYVKTSEGVKLGIGLEDKLYKDIEEVKKERNEFNEEVKSKKEQIYKQLTEINNKISNLEKLEQSENSWLEEIEAVFNI